eukprot:3826910-Prymnesium_polylepis.1
MSVGSCSWSTCNASQDKVFKQTKQGTRTARAVGASLACCLSNRTPRADLFVSGLTSRGMRCRRSKYK